MTGDILVITRDLPTPYFTTIWRHGDNIKYILGTSRHDTVMLIFNGNLKLHKDWYDRMHFKTLISAGYIIEGNPFRCHGESTTMEARSRPVEDTEILIEWLNEKPR